MKQLTAFLLCLALAFLPCASGDTVIVVGQPAGGGGGGPTLIAQDDFEAYLDNASLEDAADWDLATADGLIVKRPGGDSTFTQAGGNAQNFVYYSGAAFSADQRAEATVDVTGGAFERVGVEVRIQTG
jgi:hypothetical protein